ncbi:MAG TPA: ligase-associated DNA damage response exonuclease, partial [Chitinophagaceae bacterium]|nr:ligase-associated DNA damage response exonuclease [Chitinophagaceae bacterium]
MTGETLLRLTDEGLYCEQGDFYIDPWKPVKNAIITHAHSDHARVGHESYLCHTLTAPLLQLRLGPVSLETLGWNETRTVNGVKISLHPAGHIIGSAQIRVEYKGEIWVASGDYKPEQDQLSGQFEPVRCHTFITESTFGLPIYQWQAQSQVFESMKVWIRKNQSDGYHSLLLAYSLGKAQRVLKGLETAGLPFYAHGAVANVQETLAPFIPDLPGVQRIESRDQLRDGPPGIIIAPPAVLGSSWCNRIKPFRSAMISGWMQVRGNLRRSGTDT